MDITNYGFGPWNRFPRILGPKIAYYWELLYKKLPIGGVVYMAQNRLGLQGNPIELPLVMDTAT